MPSHFGHIPSCICATQESDQTAWTDRAQVTRIAAVSRRFTSHLSTLFGFMLLPLLSILLMGSCTKELPNHYSTQEPGWNGSNSRDVTSDSAILDFYLTRNPGLDGLTGTHIVVVPWNDGKRPMYDDLPLEGSWEVPAQTDMEIPDEDIRQMFPPPVHVWAKLTGLIPGQAYIAWCVAQYGTVPYVCDLFFWTPLFSRMQVTSTSWNGASFEAEAYDSAAPGDWSFKLEALDKKQPKVEYLSDNIWITRNTLVNPYETSPRNLKAKFQNGILSAAVQDLNPGARYSVLAYRESNGRTMISDLVEFTTEDVQRPDAPEISELTFSTAVIRFQMPLEASGHPGVELQMDDGEEYTELNTPQPEWDESTESYSIRLTGLSDRFTYHIRTYYLKDGRRVTSDVVHFIPYDFQ